MDGLSNTVTLVTFTALIFTATGAIGILLSPLLCFPLSPLRCSPFLSHPLVAAIQHYPLPHCPGPGLQKTTTTPFPFFTPKGNHRTTISTPFLILMPPNLHNSTQLPNILMIPNLPETTQPTQKLKKNKITNNKTKIKTETTITTTTTTTIKIRMILLLSSNGLA